MVAPIPELMATCREWPVPSALPSRECECEMLTVEAPIWSASVRIHHRCPRDTLGVAPGPQRFRNHHASTVDCQQSTCIPSECVCGLCLGHGDKSRRRPAGGIRIRVILDET